MQAQLTSLKTCSGPSVLLWGILTVIVLHVLVLFAEYPSSSELFLITLLIRSNACACLGGGGDASGSDGGAARVTARFGRVQAATECVCRGEPSQDADLAVIPEV